MQFVINTKSTSLRRRKERFFIRRDGVAHEFAAAKIDTIVVATGVHFTSDVVQLANQHIVSVHRANWTISDFGDHRESRLLACTTCQCNNKSRRRRGATTFKGLRANRTLGNPASPVAFSESGSSSRSKFGRMPRVQAARQQRIADENRAAAEAEARAVLAAEDAKLPADVRAIVQLCRSQGWFEAQDSNAFLNGMESYLQETPSPSPAVVGCLKEQVFESGKAPFASWKGHWADPTKKNPKGTKYKLTSGRARAIILKLKQFEG